MRDYNEKPEVVVVTGASAGLGRAVVREFARHGAHIGLIARGGAGMDGLEGAKRDVEQLGGKAVIVPADVANYDEVKAAAAKVEETFGPIDIWVNDAMVTVLAELKDISPEDFKRATEVTYLGQVWGTKVALNHMLPRDRGHIILVGSALAYRGIPLQSAYCGAKHGIEGMFDSLRCELLHDKSNVRVSMVQMPAMNTPQFSWCKTKMPNQPQPVPPIYQPEVAARAVYYTAHSRRRELLVGLSTVIVVQGNKVLPALGDWYLARTGYKGQQTKKPISPNRKDNLYDPVPGDHGAHGDFNDRSRGRSLQVWLDTHVNVVAMAGAGIATAAVAVLGMTIRGSRR
jgi:NAD(P)-dependent dehydrogenase (short-subunit alcohol dehydrogenase family)